MAVKRATPAQLQAVAGDPGMTLTDEDVGSFLARARRAFEQGADWLSRYAWDFPS